MSSCERLGTAEEVERGYAREAERMLAEYTLSDPPSPAAAFPLP